MGWYLDNAVERNKEAPYTFYIPSKSVIDKLDEGEFVKLIFASKNDKEEYTSERMWVKIIERRDDNFIGVLHNTPSYVKELNYGQEILFSSKNICSTMIDDPDSAKFEYFRTKKIIVSNDVLKYRKFNVMLRDQPIDENDTGWTFLTGEEEENEDSNDLQSISLGVILNIDDSILEIIKEEPLCAFERDLKTDKFYKVEDYEWETE